jgi:hypothetical protein
VRVAAWGLAWHETTTVAVFGLLGSIVAMLGGLGTALIGTHRKADTAHAAAEESQKVVIKIEHLVNNRMDRMEAALAAAGLYQAELIAAVTAVGGVIPEPTQAVVLLPPAEDESPQPRPGSPAS